MLTTMAEAYKVCRLRGQTLTPWQAFYLATLGNARVLQQADQTGSFQPGRHADFVVLDEGTSPALTMKQPYSHTLAETLFNLMILGDDRAITATIVAGEIRYQAASATIAPSSLKSTHFTQGA